jgi:hypothetical protein
VPGRYTIKLRARGRELTENVDVRVDPRAGTNPDALQQRFTASRDLNELGRAYFDAAAAVDAMDKQVQAINAALKDKPGIADVTAAVDEVSKKLSGVKEKFTTSFGTSLRFRIIDLLGQLQASTTAPTEAQLTALAQITDELTEAITARPRGALEGEEHQPLPRPADRAAEAALPVHPRADAQHPGRDDGERTQERAARAPARVLNRIRVRQVVDVDERRYARLADERHSFDAQIDE